MVRFFFYYVAWFEMISDMVCDMAAFLNRNHFLQETNDQVNFAVTDITVTIFKWTVSCALWLSRMICYILMQTPAPHKQTHITLKLTNEHSYY